MNYSWRRIDNSDGKQKSDISLHIGERAQLSAPHGRAQTDIVYGGMPAADTFLINRIDGEGRAQQTLPLYFPSTRRGLAFPTQILDAASEAQERLSVLDLDKDRILLRHLNPYMKMPIERQESLVRAILRTPFKGIVIPFG